MSYALHNNTGCSLVFTAAWWLPRPRAGSRGAAGSRTRPECRWRTVRRWPNSPLLINISTIYVLGFSLEAFPGRLIMQPTSGSFEARMKLSDATS